MRPFLYLLSFALVATAAAQSQGPRLRVVDDDTGFMIPADKLQIGATATADPQGGPGAMRLSNITRATNVQIASTGYRPLTVSVRPQDQTVVVRLKSLTPPAELTSDALARLRSDGKIAIAGFVSDAGTGAALSGVRVAGFGQSSETNARGFVALAAAPPRDYSNESGVLVEIRFERTGYRTLVRKNARVTRNSVRKYRVALKPGTGTDVVDELARRDETSDPPRDRAAVGKASARILGAPPTLPSSVRVGRDCATSTTCKTTEVASLDDYVKHVLPNEWIPAWHSDSLKAGSVAVRSVGVWFTNNPKADTYDVCDTTACQKYDPDVSDEATDKASDDTSKKVLVKTGTNSVVKSEYAAENNDAGCGDGKAGNDTTASPCVDDVVCKGKARNGHGRGMCQWGSQRWASGKAADGSAAPGGAQPMSWILSHYYPTYQTVTGS